MDKVVFTKDNIKERIKHRLLVKRCANSRNLS